MSPVICVPGDMLEGGGQIVRTSIALAAVLNRGVKVKGVRAKRPNPGLKAQHIIGVRAVAALCHAITEGVRMGSREMIFKPQRRKGGKFRFEVGTAGSTALVLQALMPAAAFSPSEVNIEVGGGTDVRWSPPIDYLRLIVLPMLSMMGYLAGIEVKRRGHYPRGGGVVTVGVKSIKELKSVHLLERGDVVEVGGVSHCVKLPIHVAERQARAAEKKLRDGGYRDVGVEVEGYRPCEDHHLGPGSGITLYAETEKGVVLGGDALGERGKPAERVGEEAAEKLLAELESGGVLDRHMGDIIIPYLSVAQGSSKVSVSTLTLHTLTNIRVAELVAGVKFKVEGNLNESGVISVEGVNLRV